VSLASSRSARTRRDVKTTSRRRPTGLEEQNEENIARWEVRRHSRRRHARARDPPRVPRGDSSRVVASVATRAVARRPRARVDTTDFVVVATRPFFPAPSRARATPSIHIFFFFNNPRVDP